MSPGQRSYFQNPYERKGDASHASIFLVALVLLVGVAAILFYGSDTALPANPSSIVAVELPSSISRPTTTPTPAATATAPQPAAAPAATAAPTSSAPPTSAPASGAPPSPTAKPTQAAAPAPAREAVVANAANGAFLSRTPSQSDRLLAWPNGTPLQLSGEEREAQGIRWVKVKDPRGNTGWMPKQYVQILNR